MTEESRPLFSKSLPGPTRKIQFFKEPPLWGEDIAPNLRGYNLRQETAPDLREPTVLGDGTGCFFRGLSLGGGITHAFRADTDQAPGTAPSLTGEA